MIVAAEAEVTVDVAVTAANAKMPSKMFAIAKVKCDSTKIFTMDPLAAATKLANTNKPKLCSTPFSNCKKRKANATALATKLDLNRVNMKHLFRERSVAEFRGKIFAAYLHTEQCRGILKTKKGSRTGVKKLDHFGG
jgi:hypothetical protein